ncbi:hypothetical protein BT93_H3805 [Corymbia citriodora subsp. variegata]|nr:hypothetical protein BT93_H3805 [Corymbia citriodora subsp. variegata]
MHVGVSRCFPWLLCHHWGKLINVFNGKKRDRLGTLPDDVVEDVLSRLEIDELDNAKRVCRRWHALIATAHFTRVHLQRASSVTVMCSPLSKRGLYHEPFLFYWDWGFPEEKPIREATLPGFQRIAKRRWFCNLPGCCDGLLIILVDVSRNFYEIPNPVTQEQVQLRLEGSICGFFLHSLPNKYRLLSYRETPNGFLYRMGGLGPAAWNDVGTFPYRPREQEDPSGIEGRLHWMVVGKECMSPPCSHCIMVFSTRESKFCFMPHPGDSCLSRDGHSNMHLMEMKGRVYVYAIRDKLMRLWVLEDYASWHWARKCDINLERDFNLHLASQSLTSYSNYEDMQLMDSQGGELLLGFFRYNLQSKTITQVSSDCSEKRTVSRVVVEVKSSLVSLKDLQRS